MIWTGCARFLWISDGRSRGVRARDLILSFCTSEGNSINLHSRNLLVSSSRNLS